MAKKWENLIILSMTTYKQAFSYTVGSPVMKSIEILSNFPFGWEVAVIAL